MPCSDEPNLYIPKLKSNCFLDRKPFFLCGGPEKRVRIKTFSNSNKIYALGNVFWDNCSTTTELFKCSKLTAVKRSLLNNSLKQRFQAFKSSFLIGPTAKKGGWGALRPFKKENSSWGPLSGLSVRTAKIIMIFFVASFSYCTLRITFLLFLRSFFHNFAYYNISMHF